jgi:hypothetical protein
MELAVLGLIVEGVEEGLWSFEVMPAAPLFWPLMMRGSNSRD